MDGDIFVNKKQIAQRLGVGSRKAAELVTADYWPAPIELAPRVLRWRWSEIEQALSTRAPRRVERQEPVPLRSAREHRSVASDA